MPTGLELPDFEPEDSLELSIETIKVELAEAYLNRDFSDDNVSEINHLTNFQQAIKFYLEELPIYEDITELYREIINIARKMYIGEYEEGDSSDEPDDDVSEIEDDVIEIEDEDEKEVLLFCRKVAKYMLSGILTDDAKGEFSERTALEELIIYELGYGEEEEIANVKNEIWRQIVSIRGGYDGSRIEKLIFRKTD